MFKIFKKIRHTVSTDSISLDYLHLKNRNRKRSLKRERLLKALLLENTAKGKLKF